MKWRDDFLELLIVMVDPFGNETCGIGPVTKFFDFWLMVTREGGGAAFAYDRQTAAFPNFLSIALQQSCSLPGRARKNNSGSTPSHSETTVPAAVSITSIRR